MKNFKLNFIHLCDEVIFAQDGKVSLIGIFDVINLVALPGSLAKAVLVFNLGISKKIGKADLDIAIKELSSEKEVLKVPTMSISLPDKPGESRLGVTLNLVNITFQNTGKYLVEAYAKK